MATTNQTDERVKALFDVVRARREEIAKIENPSWVTNCNFNYDPNASGVHTQSNIQTIKEVPALVRILAFLLAQEEYFNKAADILLVDDEFRWGGYTTAQWRQDINTRISKIRVSEKKAELKKLEDRLNAILSPELKAQLELEAIERELGTKAP